MAGKQKLQAKLEKAALSAKQSAFVREYVVDCNATQAAIRAGYSRKSAPRQGWRLLQHAGVSSAIQTATAKLAARAKASAERVLRELGLLALSNPKDLFSWTDQGVVLKPSADLSYDQTACITEISGTQGRLRIKLADKLPALRLLMEHLGLLKQRHEHSGTVEMQHNWDLTRLTNEQLDAFESLVDILEGPDSPGAGEA